MKGARGFTLFEIGIVLIIVAVLGTGLITSMVSVAVQAKRRDTSTRLVTVENALAMFASQAGRLPCPADGTRDATLHSDAGLETRDAATGDCLNMQRNGVVPWRSIGLAEPDTLDGYGNRFTYRVAIGLSRDNAMNFSRCDPAGTGPAIGAAPYQACEAVACSNATLTMCTSPQSIVLNRGVRVNNQAGIAIADPTATPASTGAAYVVISHGENGNGAYNSAGVLQAGGPTVGTSELANAADQAYASGIALVEAPANFSQTSARFDDFVLRPTVLQVAAKAGLAPRNQP